MRKPDESSVSSTQDSEQDESENKIDQLLSPTLVSSLKAQGITELFPIQKQCFKPICDGKHMIARARTGSGKTLAFLLPMFEILIKSKCKNPRVVILAPTRELATQIATVSETTVKSLKAVAIYGGASYQMQERALRGGADIVVGTPGRLKDLLNKGTLTIAEVNHVILDEVDRMLDMGFKDDVTEILDIIKSGTKNENQLRYLFFSATLTPWVYQSSRVYMKNGEKIEIDLIGNNDLKTSEDVKHLAVSCHLSGRPSVISNLIRLYGSNSGSKDSKAIVFCQRKAEVDELALSASMANSHK
ncbi:MAG: Nucleolar RNA helicase 2, partial [Paramarteilia canceri]